MGLVNGFDFWKYSFAMDGAADPSDGDDLRIAGGIASVVYDQDTGM